MSSFSLGIDLGTTSVKACLIDENQIIIKEASAIHGATMPTYNAKFHEQCARRMLRSVFELIRVEFSDEQLMRRTSSIGVSGQMHGIILWNADSLQNTANNDASDAWICSNLITWMDQRCDNDFLATLPKWLNGSGEEESRISTGYGIATLAWLRAHRQLDPRWDRCGTIMEFFIAVITGLEHVPISTQNAYHWGYCNKCEWLTEILREVVPINLLPNIVEPNCFVGKTKENLATKIFPPNINVTVAIGDSQASYLPILKEGHAAIHVGTSSQLVFSTQRKVPTAVLRKFSAIMTWPYFQSDAILVAVASLNGGNALETFAKQVAAWSHELYGTPRVPLLRNDIFERALNTSTVTKSSLKISPLFYGERHNPDTFATVRNWSNDTTATQMLQEIARGTIRNLSEMMPAEVLSEFGISSIRLVNRANQTAYRAEAVEAFAPLKIDSIETGTERLLSAAYGAALFSTQLSQNTNYN